MMRRPVHTLATLTCVAITIATICLFGAAARAIAPQPLPVADAHALYDIVQTDLQGRILSAGALPYDMFDAVRHAFGTQAATLGYTWFGTVVGRAGAAQQVGAELVSADYFTILGLEPIAGVLWFPSSSERGPADPTGVISERIWRSECAADRSLEGCELLVNGMRVRVIGVVPERFQGLWAPGLTSTDVWMPLGMNQSVRGLEAQDAKPPDVLVKTRWRAADPAHQAIAQIDARGTAAVNGLADGREVRIVARNGGLSRMAEQTQQSLAAISNVFRAFGLVVLAIACVNLANLAVSRALDRSAELAVRRTLGATGLSLILSATSEFAALIIIGATVGSALGYWLTHTLALLLANPLPGLRLSIPLSLQFADVALGIGTTSVLLLVSALPALRQLQTLDLIMFLRGAPIGVRWRGHVGGRYALLFPQLAAATALLLMASALVSDVRQFAMQDNAPKLRGVTALTLTRIPSVSRDGGPQASAKPSTSGDAPGRRPSNRTTRNDGKQARQPTSPSADDRTDSAARAASDADRIIHAAEREGGVVALANRVPYAFGEPARSWVAPAGRTEDRQSRRLAAITYASETYPSVLACRIISGRWLIDSDRLQSPTPAVLNEALATQLGLGADAVGTAVAMETGVDEADRAVWEATRIVGVVNCPTDRGSGASLFVPLRDGAPGNLYAFVDSTPGSERTRRLRAALDTPALGWRVIDASTLTDYERARTRPLRLMYVSAAIVGGLAFVMSIIGLFGTISYLVQARARDVAIQIALGCPRTSAVGQLLQIVLLVLSAAVATGAFVAWAGLRAAGGWSLWNPLSAGALAALVVVALLAAALPARRAAAIDPAAMLREG